MLCVINNIDDEKRRELCVSGKKKSKINKILVYFLRLLRLECAVHMENDGLVLLNEVKKIRQKKNLNSKSSMFEIRPSEKSGKK